MDPITWVILIGGFLTGILFRHFWNEIKYWATKVLVEILKAINEAIEVASDAFVYFIQEGNKIYEKMEVYVQNVENPQRIRTEVVKQQVHDISQIPQEIREQLEQKRQLKLMQMKT